MNAVNSYGQGSKSWEEVARNAMADRANLLRENTKLKQFAAGLEMNLAAVIQRAEAAESKLATSAPDLADTIARLELELAEARTKIEGLTVDEDWTKDDHVAMVNEANERLREFASGLEINLAAVIERAESAEGKLAEAQKDSERLDWLDKNPRRIAARGQK
jgi:predicted  nucleic acid-binding Zn-ribbon protein